VVYYMVTAVNTALWRLDSRALFRSRSVSHFQVGKSRDARRRHSTPNRHQVGGTADYCQCATSTEQL